MMFSGPSQHFRTTPYLNVALLACVGMVMIDRSTMTPLRPLKSTMAE
jgi:hypothetical protein